MYGVTNRVPVEGVFFVASSEGQDDVLLVFMLDQLSEGQWHVAIHCLDRTAIGVDFFNIRCDVFTACDSSDHGLALFVAYDFRVQ
jgi:hypothetical protein